MVEGNSYESGYLDANELQTDSFTEKLIGKIQNPDFEEYFEHPVDIFDTVIISDIHLGNKFSRARELNYFLKTVKFKHLIINGDVFDDINMKRLDKHHWKVLSKLRKLTEKDKNIEVTWIRGNHDGYSDLISQLLGIEFLHESIIEWNDKRILVIHGDMFDRFTFNPSYIGHIGDFLYKMALHLDPEDRKIGSWLKRSSRAYMRNLEKVRERATEYAKTKDCDMVICGHTHFVEQGEYNDVRYLNTGSWAGDTPSHFIGITGSQIKLVPFI